MSASLRARLAKLEQQVRESEAIKAKQPTDDLTLFRHAGCEIYSAALDRKAIEEGRECALTHMGYLKPGAIEILAERGHEIARIVLKLRGYIEERAQDGDVLLKSAARGLLDGMRPIEQQAKE
jgi:hypothetical protein